MLTLYDYIYLITGAFRTYIIYKFMSLFFDRSETDKKIEVFSYIVYSIAISIIYLAINVPVITLIANILFSLALSFNYKSIFKNRLIAIGFIYIILISIESIIALLSGYVYSSIFNKNKLYSSIVGMVAIQLVSYIVVLLMNNYKNIKKGINISNIYWFSIFLIPLGSLYIILILLQTFDVHILGIITSIIILFSINIVVFYLYDALNEVFEEKLSKVSLKQQNKYYQNEIKIINNSYKNIRSLKHDIKNHLIAIKEYIKNEEEKKALDYIFQIEDISDKDNSFSNTGNIDIDSILNYKLQEAELKEISPSVDIKVPSTLKISSADLVVILGNLLDNAIESNLKIENNRKVDIRIIYKNSILFIYINNTFDGNVVYQGDNIVTSKKDKESHGMGLSNIKDILKKYDGMIKTYHTEKKFYTQVLLYIQ